MCFIGPMPQVSTEEYSVPVVLLMHLVSSAPQVHIAVFMCVTSLCLCVVLYSLVGCVWYSFVSVCVWYSTRLCRGVLLVRFTTTKRLHSMHTATSQLHSTTLEKHAKTTQMTTPAKLTHSLHKVPCGPVTEIYSDTPVLK